MHRVSPEHAAPPRRAPELLLTGLVCCLLLAACGASASPGNTTGANGNLTSSRPTTTTTTLGLRQPTASRPLTIMDVGDSLGEDLGLGLGYTLATDTAVRVVQAAYGDSGLARPDFYNWPAHLASDLAQYHPQVVTILIGGNDGQGLYLGPGSWATFGTAQWRTDYVRRVAQMMDEVLKAGARLVWVGLPIMQDAGFAATMQMLNGIYKRQSALHRGVLYMPTWALFSNAQGQYSAYLTNSLGQNVLARDPDGVHIAPPGGCDIVAVATIKAIERTWHIRLSYVADAS